MTLLASAAGLLAAAIPVLPSYCASGERELQPGSLAPAHELSSPIQGELRELSDLRGRVVVLHTFAWNCDSCLRVGIPLSVELRNANAPDLEVISITTPAMREETLEVMQRFGVTQPVAAANPMGDECPYVDMANGITYMWVIGRNGDIVWRGDPSTKEEECLAAVGAALADRADRSLGRALHPALAEAAGRFASGAYDDAKEAAEKLGKSLRKSDGDAEPIAADAAYLSERIAARLTELTSALAKAAADRDAAAFVAQRAELALGFSKAETAAAMKAASAGLEDPAFKAAVAEEEAWLALKRARPALYGVRRDKAADRYAASLREFLKGHAESAHAEEAQRLLALAEKNAQGR